MVSGGTRRSQGHFRRFQEISGVFEGDPLGSQKHHKKFQESFGDFKGIPGGLRGASGVSGFQRVQENFMNPRGSIGCFRWSQMRSTDPRCLQGVP